MKRSRFTEEQIVAILKEHELGAKAADLARKHGISEATLYNWKAKYGGIFQMQLVDAPHDRQVRGRYRPTLAWRSSLGSPITTTLARIPRWSTEHRRLLPLTFPQPAIALRSSMAPRSGRLLNPRRKAYQPPRL